MLNQFNFHRRYSIILLLIVLAALAACFVEPEPTWQSAPVSPIPLTPSETPFPSTAWFTIDETPAFEISWTLRPFVSYFIQVSQDGDIQRWREIYEANIQAHHNGVLPQELMSVFREGLLQLESQQQTNDIFGSEMVTMTMYGENELTVTCGNQNCPTIIRDFIWQTKLEIDNTLRYDESPFVDEELLFIKIQSSQLAMVSWFDDLTQPFQTVGIGKDNTIYTSRYISSSEQTAFEMWTIQEREKRRMQTCLETLPSMPQTDSGHDLEVIKVAFLHNDEPLLLRFDRSNPPECLVDMMALLDKSLHRQQPGTLVEIDPFG